MSRNELASTRAYRVLRNAILTLELKPGEHLREADLVSNFELGRTPIREALHRLASEHLVEIRPGSGAHVTEVTLSDVGDIFEMRETLVPLEICAAIRGADEEDLQGLHDIMGALEDYPPEKNYELDLEFHACIAAMTGNSYLVRTLEMLNIHSIRMFRVTRATRIPVDELVQEHRSLGEAIMQGDVAKATEIALHHVQDSKRRLLESL